MNDVFKARELVKRGEDMIYLWEGLIRGTRDTTSIST